jgi:hypothetical protein
MAIQSNASTDEVVGGVKLYTGLTNMNIIMINPTLKELQDNDIKFKQDPEYFVEINDVEYFKLTFWLKNEDITVRMEVLLNNTFRQSKGGKYQWINNIGQDTWSEESPTYEWWKTEGEHKAYSGEETLIKFMKAWANVASGDEVSFDTIDKIVEGDVLEVQQLVSALKDNQVRVLLGAKEDKYQQIYMRYFGRIKPQRDDYFVKELNTEYGEFKAEYDPTLTYGPYVPMVGTVKPDVEEPETVEEESDWID